MARIRVQRLVSSGPRTGPKPAPHITLLVHLRRRSAMRTILGAVGILAAFVATDASAQGVNLSGEYQCVQGCELGLPGPAYITQYGWNMNLVNEAGVPSRAWIDWAGHLWAQDWYEGAIISPDGMTIQFDRGTVWRRDFGEPPVLIRRY